MDSDSDSDSGQMDSDSHLMDSDSGLMDSDSDSDSGLVDSDSLPDSRVRTHSNTDLYKVHFCGVHSHIIKTIIDRFETHLPLRWLPLYRTVGRIHG